MSFILAAQAELLKTKRTASFWISIIGAGFIPSIYLLLFLLNPEETIQDMGAQPWAVYLKRAWQILSVFILPITIILITTLVTQIEFKNNTWKQVYASPQSYGNIFFSKFLTIHIMFLFCLLMFNIMILGVGVIANLTNPGFAFLDHPIDWVMLAKQNFKTYISILGISAIQYWASLRFKNFIVSVGIGLGLALVALIGFIMHWPHIDKYPFSFPTLTLDYIQKPNRPFIENHELNSIGYFVFFSVLGFLDMKLRKEKG